MVKRYRDDDGIERLQSFQGCSRPVPLAISIINDRFNVGQTALQHYEQHLPNSFYKLFSLLKGNETYTLFGAQKPANTLLYIAIETILAKLIKDEFGEDLNVVRNTLPIGFDFEPDITEEERNAVLDLFRNGYNGECGRYGNVGVIDTNEIIANNVLSGNFRKYAMVLDNSGSDIMASLYSKEENRCISSRVLPGLALDPGIAEGVKKIKLQIQDINPYIRDFSPVEEKLQEIVSTFISTDKPETYGSVKINTEDYQYFIARCDVNASGSMHSTNVITDIKSIAYNAAGLSLSDIVFAIRGAALRSDYFMRIFRGEMDCVKIVDDDFIQNLDAIIIRDMVESGWTLDPKGKQRKHLDEEFSELRQRIEYVLIPQGHYVPALNELNDFLAKCSSIGFHGHDEHIQKYVTQIIELQQGQGKPNHSKPQPKPQPPVTSESPVLTPQGQGEELLGEWRKMVNDTEKDVKKLIASGMYSEAREQVNILRDDMRTYGIHNFDDEIRRLYSLLPTSKPTPQEPRRPIPQPAPPKQQPNTPISDSPYYEIVSKLGFAGAKKWCTENDDIDGAILMGKLDKLHKKYELAAACLDNYVAEGNKVGIKRFETDLSQYVSLLKEAKLSSVEEEELLEKYRSHL